jgi:7tm Chemosensory receptor
MLNALASATRQIFDDLETFKTKNSLTKQFHELWYLFEQLRLKVDEANNLFGILALLVHAIFFLIVCLTVDTFVVNSKSLQLADLIALSTFFFIFAMFLIRVILIASESEKSSRQLAVAVWMEISQNGFLLTETERLSAALYLNNVQSNMLTARPCEMYDINNSLLLHIFGTVLTYTIIVLQSA